MPNPKRGKGAPQRINLFALVLDPVELGLGPVDLGNIVNEIELDINLIDLVNDIAKIDETYAMLDQIDDALSGGPA